MVVLWSFLAGLAAVFILLWLVLRIGARQFVANPDHPANHGHVAPQVGGLVIMPVMLAGALAVWLFDPNGFHPLPLGLFVLMVGVIALTGAVDDLRGLSVRLRLAVQIAVAATATAGITGIFAGAGGVSVTWLAISAAMVIGLVWYMNAINFMDGIDLITVANLLPGFLGLALLSLGGLFPAGYGAVAMLAAGGLAAFAWFNRPVARAFLGDSGSLGLGLAAGILSAQFFMIQGSMLFVLLFAYPLTDATLTLARRLVAGRPLLKAHRDHFYQRAQANGLSSARIALTVLVTGCICVVVVLASFVALPGWVEAGCVAAAVLSMATTLAGFSRRQPPADSQVGGRPAQTGVREE